MTQNTNPQENFSMIAPSQVNNNREDVKLLEQGVNVGILYSMIDLGTHLNTHFNKRNRMIRFTFEFPLLKQLFKIDDVELRPTVVSKEISFQMAPKSNLKKFVDGALGRTLQEHEYKGGYDLGQFLGKMMIVNIVNRASAKDATKIYNNIDSVSGITEHSKSVYNFEWNLIQRTNPLQGFMIGDGSVFATERFSSLPRFIREKIKESDEGKAWAKNGGVFAEPVYTNNGNAPVQTNNAIQPPVQRDAVAQAQQVQSNQQAAPQAPVAPAPVSQAPKFVYTNTEFTYEVMKSGGWTEQMLVDNGYAKWEQPTPPPAPVPPTAPAPPMPPQAPTPPPTPVAPQAPTAPQAQAISFDAQGNAIDFSGEVDGVAF